jgi:hypothetical protein
MSADPLQALASAGKGKTTLGLLRVIILALIAAAAIASRLFSVIRTWPLVQQLALVSSVLERAQLGMPALQLASASLIRVNCVLTRPLLCRIREYYP